MGGETLVTTSFLQNRKGYFAKLGMRLKYYYSDEWEVREWWHQEHGFAVLKRGKKELLWGMSCQGLVTQRSFWKWKNTFFACDVPTRKYSTQNDPSNAYSASLLGAPKKLHALSTHWLTAPFEIENWEMLMNKRFKESENFIHEHFSIFLQ